MSVSMRIIETSQGEQEEAALRVARSGFKPATASTTTSTPSLFAPPASQPQAGAGTGSTNIFGSASTNSAQPAASGGSGGFTFGQPAASTSNASGQTQTNSLFGGAAPAAQGQAGAAGSAPSGGMFGGAAAPAGGSLFGQPSTATTGQPGPGQAGGGGMFGAGTQAQGAGTGAGSIFGKPATTFGQPAPASTSLFGSTTAAQPATGSGIAGSAPGQFSTFSTSIGQPQNQQQSQPSIFGQSQAQPQQQQPQAGAFGQFGQQQQQQGQSQLAQSQQQQQNDGGLQKGTKFSDLPEGHQNALKEMEKRINDRKRVGASLSTTGMDEAVRQIERQVQDVSRQTSALSSTLSSITSSLTTLQTRLRAEGVDMAHLVEIIETMSYNPSAATSQQPANTAAGGAGGMSMSVGMGLSSSTGGGVNDNRVGAARLSAAHKEWVLGYFEKMAGEMRGRIGVYRARIAELHRVIEGLGRESDGTTPQAIAQTIDNHQNAIVNLAAHIERVEMRLDEMRDQLRTFHQRNFNTMRDVFDMAREEQGLPVKSQVMLQGLTQSMRI